MPQPDKLLPAQREEIRKRWLAGEHADAIAADYGVSGAAIGYTCRALSRPRRVRTDRYEGIPERNAEIRRRYAALETGQALAVAYDLSVVQIRRICKGLHPRRERRAQETTP